MSVNKSQRDVNKQFDQKQFNTKFDENEKKINDENKQSKSEDMLRNDESVVNKLPHKRPLEDIIIIIREMFYKILELLIDKQNPIPYILSSSDRFFASAVFLIIIGSSLMLLSNLMISSDKNI
jgi:hypothetical protein